MEISKVTQDDGKYCLQLLNLLKMGRWELSGPDIAAHAATIQWFRGIASKMADSVKGQTTLPAGPSGDKPVEAMKIKSMGKLPVPSATPAMKHSKPLRKKK